MQFGRLKRRQFISLLGGSALAWPLGSQAQQPLVEQTQNTPRVGWIFPGASSGNPTEIAGFREGLRELGYADGKNIIVEYRFGENTVDLLPKFAAELAQLNVSVIVAIGELATRAARRGAPDTPIVFLTADPVGNGLVTNLMRPGSNMTGVSVMRAGGKWPELVKEALPGLSRIGYLINPTNAASVSTLNEARHSAEKLALDFRSYRVERPQDLESVYAAMSSDGINALLLDAAHPYPTDWPRVASLALKYKLPAISEIREFVFAGGLMSYGVRLFDMTRRQAQYVDKILKGAHAGDIPVEQPIKFELVINLRTAKALGLAIPATLLARADEVIE